VHAALQEDVDAIGISILSGAHMTIFPKVLSLMKAEGLTDVMLFGGGIIPDKDIGELKRMGVGDLFTPGTSTQTIIDYLRRVVEEKSNTLPGNTPANKRS